MVRLDRSQIDDWLSDRLRGTVPPVYTLERPSGGADAARSPLRRQLQERGFETLEVNPNSGSVTFVLPTNQANTIMEEYAEQLLAACQAADKRDYFWVQADGNHEGATELEIRSRLSESDMQVLGPGGRMLLVANGNAFVGDLTIRRRGGTQEADGWRRPPQLMEHLEAYGELAVTLFADTGYFETSKRETQGLLRPVLVLVAEHEPDPEREFDVGWRRLLVEPITDLHGVSPGSGIDLWYDPEGGIRG
jgi:hypothetical protein